jgi:putative transposase
VNALLLQRHMALVIDWHTRELLGWHLSRTGKATTAASFATLERVNREFLLRSENVITRE